MPRRAGKLRPLIWLPLLVLAVLYGAKPDLAAALTIFPAFVWLPPLFVLGLRRPIRKSRFYFVAVGMFAIVYCEEIPSLIRGMLPYRAAPDSLRVVSLNCAGGLLSAANEVIPLRPDIVLLQESPGPDELTELQSRLFGKEGTLVSGPDGSILTRFPAADEVRIRKLDHTTVEVVVHGKRVRVISLRLAPPAFRVDLLNPDAWTDVATNRIARREEIRELFQPFPNVPTIAGGDFNCQSGDTSLSTMPDWLRDVYYEAGRGWGHTCVNEYPLARIDKVWVTRDFEGIRQWVQPTQNSDHRMVITDLRMR